MKQSRTDQFNRYKKENRTRKQKALLIVSTIVLGIFIIGGCGGKSSNVNDTQKTETKEKKAEAIFNVTAFKNQTLSSIEKTYGKPIKSDVVKSWIMADTGEKVKVTNYYYEINGDSFQFSFYKDNVLGMVYYIPNKNNKISTLTAEQIKKFDFGVFGLPNDNNLERNVTHAVTWKGFKDLYSVTLIGLPNAEATAVPQTEFKFVLEKQYR
ncbi:hypothetical protein [Paenibacillus tyrfis]|uniref:hypothetical protein n=1 Tax=Paenibacillus tyrfis TaxID=1501230 RepID=UPI00209FA7B7|nr:hypothetical protein [Paenibacillus tyrfis]MCP1307664.1 hypothetical protein [Paenibacillus tyrfis]